MNNIIEREENSCFWKDEELKENCAFDEHKEGLENHSCTRATRGQKYGNLWGTRIINSKKRTLREQANSLLLFLPKILIYIFKGPAKKHKRMENLLCNQDFHFFLTGDGQNWSELDGCMPFSSLVPRVPETVTALMEHFLCNFSSIEKRKWKVSLQSKYCHQNISFLIFLMQFARWFVWYKLEFWSEIGFPRENSSKQDHLLLVHALLRPSKLRICLSFPFPEHASRAHLGSSMYAQYFFCILVFLSERVFFSQIIIQTSSSPSSVFFPISNLLWQMNEVSDSKCDFQRKSPFHWINIRCSNRLRICNGLGFCLFFAFSYSIIEVSTQSTAQPNTLIM